MTADQPKTFEAWAQSYWTAGSESDRDGDAEEAWNAAIEAAAQMAASGCVYDLGWDREQGPLGCALCLREGCVCMGMTMSIRELKTGTGQ